MSSHHIIRENQEPALFVADPHVLADFYMGQLLEWSPTLLTLSSHYETLLSRGIKVDVVILDQQLAVEPEEHLVLLPMEAGIYPSLFGYLQEKGKTAVNILCETPRLADFRPWIPDFTISCISRDFKYIFLKSYEKWLPAGLILHVPEVDETLLSLFSNVKLLQDGYLEVLQDGFVRLEEQGDYLIIGEAL